MKSPSLLGFLFAVAAAPMCAAQTSGFAVDLVAPSNAILFMDGAWQRDAECLKISVSVQEQVTSPVLKAYFYGADGTLLYTANKPPSQGDGKGGFIKLPTPFEKDKKYDVFFGIPKAAERWKRAIIVFGKPGEYAAKIYPNDDPAKFDFPEKASASVSAAPVQTAQTLGFAVDLINPSRAYLVVDDAWKQNAECLQVKVSVATEVSNPVLKAYFYGGDGTLLHTARAPSSQGDTDRNEIPPQRHFEKGKRYEAFFGIPMAAAKWKRVIIVFGLPGDYAARIYPKDDLAKFDFPENAIAVPTQATASASQNLPRPIQEKPVAELEALKAKFEARVTQEVQQPYDAGIKDLNAKYISALVRAQQTAQRSGKLEEAVAIKGDKEAVATGRGVPAADGASTPPVVKSLRGTYRVAFSRLEAERVKRLQPLQAAFSKSLDALVTSLTKEGKLDEAMVVKYQRDELAAVPVAAAATGVLGQTLGGPKVVLTARANIPANSPDGYKFGPVSKGDLITLKYLEGRWKDFGTQPSFNPDDPATVESSRLVVAKSSKDDVPGDVIVMVPPSTALTSFEFESPIASDQLVLRINANSNNGANPGAVVYQLEVKRLNGAVVPVALGQPPGELPELWTWHLKPDIGPSGTILFKKDGTVEQKIDGRQSSTFGTWKATDVHGVLSVTLGVEACTMTITGSDAVFDASFGKSHLKVVKASAP